MLLDLALCNFGMYKLLVGRYYILYTKKWFNSDAYTAVLQSFLKSPHGLIKWGDQAHRYKRSKPSRPLKIIHHVLAGLEVPLEQEEITRDRKDKADNRVKIHTPVVIKTTKIPPPLTSVLVVQGESKSLEGG